MSNTAVHALVGAAAAVLPDAALVLTIGRDWLPRDHPVIRVHAWLHRSPAGLILAGALGWGSHLLLDRYTRHNTPAGTLERRGWSW